MRTPVVRAMETLMDRALMQKASKKYHMLLCGFENEIEGGKGVEAAGEWVDGGSAGSKLTHSQPSLHPP